VQNKPMASTPFDCQSCGACCAYAADWPRFTLEDDTAIARIPAALVNDSGSGMRCTADRCAALSGTVGTSVTCTIYSVRPEVCRSCEAGDDACRIARAYFGLAPVESAEIAKIALSR
jgi:Fe-S-cluster containining protein